MNEAFCRDCVEAMKEYPDKYFDLVVADPPYGINMASHNRTKDGYATAYGNNRNNYAHLKYYPVFNDEKEPGADTFSEIMRVGKKVIIWGGNYFLDHLGRATCMIVWDKKRRGMDQADCEIAWTNIKEQSRVFEYIWNGMHQQNMANKEQRIHVTQKPVDLYRWIFARYAQKGEKVLDPFLGSGSSRIAALDAGLDFVGFEIDKRIFALEEERYSAYEAQLNLFRQ